MLISLTKKIRKSIVIEKKVKIHIEEKNIAGMIEIILREREVKPINVVLINPQAKILVLT